MSTTKWSMPLHRPTLVNQSTDRNIYKQFPDNVSRTETKRPTYLPTTEF